MSKQRKVQLQEDIINGVKELGGQSGSDFSDIVNELLDVALKMRIVPGIVFADTHSGRVVTIGGTGLGVWEIVMQYRTVDEIWDSLRECFRWLTEYQSPSGLAYAEAFPHETDDRIPRDEQWTPEKIYKTHPFRGSPGDL